MVVGGCANCRYVKALLCGKAINNSLVVLVVFNKTIWKHCLALKSSADRRRG